MLSHTKTASQFGRVQHLGVMTAALFLEHQAFYVPCKCKLGDNLVHTISAAAAITERLYCVVRSKLSRGRNVCAIDMQTACQKASLQMMLIYEGLAGYVTHSLLLHGACYDRGPERSIWLLYTSRGRNIITAYKPPLPNRISSNVKRKRTLIISPSNHQIKSQTFH